MTPPDGRDVAEAAVDLEGLVQRVATKLRLADNCTGSAEPCADCDREDYVGCTALARIAVAECLAASPTPATAGEPSTAEEVLGEGPAFWLNVKREPAGEPSPSLREAYARIIAPDAFRHFDAPGFPQMHPMRRGPVLDSVALARNKADAILALRTAPASSLEGEQASAVVALTLAAKEMYERSTDNGPIHSNRYPSWLELSATAQQEWIDKAALAPHQPEGGE